VTYLIDTDWLLDAIGGFHRAASTIQELAPLGLGVSIVSYGELLEGVYGFTNSDARRDELYRFLNPFQMVPLTVAVVEIFGRTRSELRRTGQLISDLDLLIAATAMHHDLILLTRNQRHFGRIPELRLYATS
jgi:predicted nucleic acid-binding protein